MTWCKMSYGRMAYICDVCQYKAGCLEMQTRVKPALTCFVVVLKKAAKALPISQACRQEHQDDGWAGSDLSSAAKEPSQSALKQELCDTCSITTSYKLVVLQGWRCLLKPIEPVSRPTSTMGSACRQDILECIERRREIFLSWKGCTTPPLGNSPSSPQRKPVPPGKLLFDRSLRRRDGAVP